MNSKARMDRRRWVKLVGLGSASAVAGGTFLRWLPLTTQLTTSAAAEGGPTAEAARPLREYIHGFEAGVVG